MGTELKIIKFEKDKNIIFLEKDKKLYKVKIVEYNEEKNLLSLYFFNTNQTINLNISNKLSDKGNIEINSISSPISGKITSIKVNENEIVKESTPLLIIESMKMENEVRAPFNLFVKTIHISNEDLVKQNQILLTIEEYKGESE